MKTLGYLLMVVAFIWGCTTKSATVADARSDVKNDTVRIANDSLEYEVIIIDPGFNNWFQTNARPRGFYSQNYLESRNIAWVTQWNIRAMNPGRDQNLFLMSIDYHAGTNYGYEVNYMLFNYLVYFQQKNRIRLGGGFVPQL